MEEKTITRQHRLMLQDRKVGSFTGILDVISFDLNEILLETEQGMLHIKGKDLHVNLDDFHYPEPTTPEGKRKCFLDIREEEPVSAKY